MRQANPGQDARHHRQPRLRHRQAQARYARQALDIVPQLRHSEPNNQGPILAYFAA